jgi:hypothetical protein
MSLVCSKCSKRAEISATYCRDCYTVFPFEQRQAALNGRRRRTELSALKWVPAIVLVGGAIWFARSESTDVPPTSVPPTEASAAPAKDDRPTTVAGRAAREDPYVAPPRKSEAPRRDSYASWALLLDEAVDCPAGNPCRGEIRFAGGASAEILIRNGDGLARRLTAADAASDVLLRRRDRGRLHVNRRGGDLWANAEKRGAVWVGSEPRADRANGG